MKIKDNRGVTLVETLLYMIIGLIVIGYALNAMTDLSKSYVQQRTVIGLQSSGRDAIMILGRDISTMGFKYFIDTVGSGKFSTTEIPGTWTGNHCFVGNAIPAGKRADSTASFFFNPATGAAMGDTLEYFKAVMADSFKVATVEAVKYYLKADSLMREVTSLTPKNGAGNPTTWASWVPADYNRSTVVNADWGATSSPEAILTNVVAFQIQFAQKYSDFSAATPPATINDPAGSRHLMKYLKISLLVKSSRSQATLFTHRDNMVAGDKTFTPPNDKFLYRKYEQIVEVPNNGVVN